MPDDVRRERVGRRQQGTLYIIYTQYHMCATRVCGSSTRRATMSADTVDGWVAPTPIRRHRRFSIVTDAGRPGWIYHPILQTLVDGVEALAAGARDRWDVSHHRCWAV